MAESNGCEIVFSSYFEEGIPMAIDVEESFDALAKKMKAQEWVDVTQQKNWRSESRRRCLINTAAVAFLREDP